MNLFKRYKHLFILVICVIAGIGIGFYAPFHDFLLSMKDYGYIGAFIAGMLFVSTFTVAAGSVTLFILAENLNPVLLVLIAGAGGVLGDFLIFRFIRDDLTIEAKLLFNDIVQIVFERTHFDFGTPYLKNLIKTKYFGWTLPVLGAIIIASPFPDELGISLMGISKLRTWQFLLISFILDCLSVFLIVGLSEIAQIG